MAKRAVKRTVKSCSTASTTPTVVSPTSVRTLPYYQCKYCGWQWNPRKAKPVQCPNCKRRNWWRRVSPS